MNVRRIVDTPLVDARTRCVIAANDWYPGRDVVGGQNLVFVR